MATAYSIDEQGKPNGCHGCGGLIGAFVVEERDGNTKIIAGDKGIEMGSYGSAPTNWNFIKLGPDDYWGWQNTSGSMNHGITGSFYSILAPYGKTIRELAGIPKSFNNEGYCETPSCEESIDSSLKIDDRVAQEKVFPLHITVTGKIKGTILAPKKYVIPFDTNKWSYSEPKNWPLKRN